MALDIDTDELQPKDTPSTADATEDPTKFREIAQEVAAGFTDVATLNRLGVILRSALEEAAANTIGTSLELGIKLVAYIARIIARGEDRAETAFGQLAAVAVEDLFGVQASPAVMTGRGNRGGRAQTAAAIGEQMLKVFGNEGGAVEPSMEPAKKYLSTMMQFALEGWLEGWIVELLSEVIPGIGGVENFGALDDIMANTLGLGRITGRIVRPLVDAKVVTPMEWAVNKAHPHRLLTPEQAVRQFNRDKWTRERLDEELHRQGYDNDRIEALINGSRRFLPVSDITWLIRRGFWTEEHGVQNLKDQGYDGDDAFYLLFVDEEQRKEQLHRQFGDAAVSAFARGDIDQGELDAVLSVAYVNTDERTIVRQTALFRRDVTLKDLTESDAEQAVKRGIINLPEYRDFLRRSGYQEFAITIKELLLTAEVNDILANTRKREELEAQRATEKQRAAEERAAKLEALRAQHAETEPTLKQVEKAVILGLLTFADYEGFLEENRYTAESIRFLVDTVEIARAQYVAKQDKRRELEERLKVDAISLEDLERAAVSGIITVDDYRARLAGRKVPAGDIEILAALLTERIALRQAAVQKREEAARRLAASQVSLADWERAVIRGVRSMADYEQLLSAFGFHAADRALLVDLLAVAVADWQLAEEERERARARLEARGISLDQAERAVLRGILSLDAYDRWLGEQGFTADARNVLVPLLAAKQADYDAAVERKRTLERERGARRVPLGDVERAVRLGVLTMGHYRGWLTREGYAAEDQDVLVALLMADLQAQRDDEARRAAVGGRIPGGALTLAQFEIAVLHGHRSLEDYQVWLAALGYLDQDRALLVALLKDRLLETVRQLAIRAQTHQAAAQRNVPLADTARAVKRGSRPPETYTALLETQGVSPEDRATLTTLLSTEVLELEDARRRRAALATSGGELARLVAESEAAVRARVRTLGDHGRVMATLGVPEGDTALFLALLALELEPA